MRSAPKSGFDGPALGDQLVRLFDELSAIPMPPHIIALTEELERLYAPPEASNVLQAADLDQDAVQAGRGGEV